MAQDVQDLITIDNDRLRVRFGRFGPKEYELFLKVKAVPETTIIAHEEDLTYTVEMPRRYAGALGVALPPPPWEPLPLSPFLFDDQRAIVGMALEEKRFACWSDCGLGKTLIGLEFARHVLHRSPGRVLIVTLNDVVPEWLREAKKFYKDTLPLLPLDSRINMRAWMKDGAPGLAITNYEKWNPEDVERQVLNEAKYLSGVILDESSRLKTGGGRQKWALIKSCRGVEYKLSLTATPAPNEIMEFASQASFLEKMRDENEIIWTYFRRDNKTHRWTVRPYARAAFFRFMAGWSIYLRDPKRYGWRQGVPEPPPADEFTHEIAITPEQHAAWLDASAEPSGQRTLYASRETNAIQRLKLSQIAKGFRYEKDPEEVRSKGGKVMRVKVHEGRYSRIPSAKPAFVADLARSERAAGLQVILWTEFDAECAILSDLLTRLGVAHAVLTGKTPRKKREQVLDAFRSGELGLLLTRAAVLGWGVNLQMCGSMIFSGFSDSWEKWYQAIRRSLRFGQTRRLRVHVPYVPELEGEQWANLQRKQAQHDSSVDEMESNYLAAKREIWAAERCLAQEG